jgi:CDP-diacylglycerol--glycerol-3-phosphate 3-phosphatidyltransferase/archaetidylinositol phosphate synthase
MFGRLREKYQQMIMPVGRILSKIGLSPNMVTILSLLVSALACYVYTIKRPVEGALLIIFMGVLDMFDGAIARATNRITRFGATFDHVIDRYAEFLIVLGLILGAYVEPLFGFFTLFSMLMASFTRAKAESVGRLTSCTVGIAERQEKLLIIICASFLISFYYQILNYAVIFVGILSSITVIQRLAFTWKETGGK